MTFERYTAALRAAFENISDSAGTYLPFLVGAAALVLGGWGIAYALQKLSARIARRFDGIARRSQVEDAIHRIGLKRPFSEVVGGFVFWTVFLFFVAAATEALGLGVLTTWFTGVAYFLPRIVGAVLVAVAGLLAANFARDAVLAASATASVTYGPALSHLVRILILLVTGLVAVNELGIDVTVLTVTLTAVLGTTLGGVALAFGFGARTAVSNIIGSHYLRQMVEIGHMVRLGDIQGEVMAITATTVVIKTAEGRAIVPAKFFHETSSTLMAMGG